MLAREMAAARMYRDDDDPMGQRLLATFAVSLMAHLSFLGVIQVGNDLNWWDSKPFSMFRKVRLTPEDIAKIQEEQRKLQEQRREQEPTLFVQVTQPSETAPTETSFYSSVSSRAANPDPGNSEQVRIDGRQTQTLRTEDAPRVETGRPTPPAEREPPGMADASPETRASLTAEPEQVAAIQVPQVTPRVPDPPRLPGLGELALPSPEAPRILEPPPKDPPPKEPVPVEKPVETPVATLPPVPTPPVAQTTPTERAPETVAPRARPRTVTEAKVRQSLLAGEKARQDGGVSRKGPVALDVKGMPFGAYDEALVTAVQNRWFALLDERRFAGGAVGKVVVKFNLHSDGSVRIVEPKESTVNDALLEAICVRAIRDPSPYEKWPSDMLRMLGSNLREMRFTFYYN